MYHFQGQQAYNNSSSGPPPAKRQKSNAVVTYYPPPPGYVPPPNAQIPQAAWQAGGYPANSYGAQQYPQAQYGQQQYNQQAYAQQQYAQQQYYQGAAQQGYQYQGYPGYQQPNGWQQHQPNQPQQAYAYPQSQGYQADAYQGHAQQYSQAGFVPPYSGSPQSLTPGLDQQDSLNQPRHPSVSLSAPAISVSGDDEEFHGHEFDETDFSREASYAKEADAVTPELSLGIIVYYPARPVKTALASTYDEAQEQMTNITPREGEDESVSRYFNKSQSANFALSVRECDGWEQLKQDVIFRSYPPITDAEFTPLAHVKRNRSRPDPSLELQNLQFEANKDFRGRPRSPTPVDDHVLQAEGSLQDEDEEAMDTDSDDDDVVVSPNAPTAMENATASKKESTAATVEGDQESHMAEAQDSVMVEKSDHVCAEGQGAPPKPVGNAGSAVKSGSNGVKAASITQRDFPPLEPYRSNSAQEKVNNSQHYDHRRHSSGHHAHDYRHIDHRKPSAGHHTNGHSGHRKFSNPAMQYGPHNIPPPPEQDQSPWNSGPYGDSRRRSGSAGSNTSQRTLPGGDFDADSDDNQKTPRVQPPLQHSGSGRKRAFEEMDEQSNNGRRRQTDDVTPKLRRGRPKVPDAYSRRYR